MTENEPTYGVKVIKTDSEIIEEMKSLGWKNCYMPDWLMNYRNNETLYAKIFGGEMFIRVCPDGYSFEKTKEIFSGEYSIETVKDVINFRPIKNVFYNVKLEKQIQRINNTNELIKLKSEYIKLLEKSLGDSAVFLHVHDFHYQQADIDKGVELRLKIAEIEKQLG